MEAITKALIETESVLISPKEPFTLASGRRSPVYVDCRRLISFPIVRKAIVQGFANIARNEIGLDRFDLVAGGETAGIPYGALVAHELDMPMIYIRKKPKGYGRDSQIEGVISEGQRVLLVEDLVTDGGSKRAFKDGVDSAGAVIDYCLCVFEYFSEAAGLKEAQVNLNAMEIDLYSLSNWDEILAVLSSQDRISESQRADVLSFLSDPEGYQARFSA